MPGKNKVNNSNIKNEEQRMILYGGNEPERKEYRTKKRSNCIQSILVYQILWCVSALMKKKPPSQNGGFFNSYILSQMIPIFLSEQNARIAPNTIEATP